MSMVLKTTLFFHQMTQSLFLSFLRYWRRMDLRLIGMFILTHIMNIQMKKTT